MDLSTGEIGDQSRTGQFISDAVWFVHFTYVHSPIDYYWFNFISFGACFSVSFVHSIQKIHKMKPNLIRPTHWFAHFRFKETYMCPRAIQQIFNSHVEYHCVSIWLCDMEIFENHSFFYYIVVLMHFAVCCIFHEYCKQWRID